MFYVEFKTLFSTLTNYIKIYSPIFGYFKNIFIFTQKERDRYRKTNSCSN